MTMIGYGFGPPLAGVSSDLFRALGVAAPLRWALVVTASFFALSGVGFLSAAAAIEKMKHSGNATRLACRLPGAGAIEASIGKVTHCNRPNKIGGEQFRDR